MPIAPWVAFVNEEARILTALENIPKSSLRGHLRDRLAETFTHPLELELRCLVVGERALEGPAYGATQVGQMLVPRAALRLLELVPEGITREAAALTGPILAASPRALQEGSVVDVRIRLTDPRAAALDAASLPCDVLDLVAVVPVEP